MYKTPQPVARQPSAMRRPEHIEPKSFSRSRARPGTLPSGTKSTRAAARPLWSPETGHIQRQPETRPISQEQLVAEVKGIYAGLVMVESKCIEVDNSQPFATSVEDSHSALKSEQWQALIALHRTLLHEHHDFFLASQHPSASPALRRLASKYAMPARMWRHGIHSFLELLRHRLPESHEHMLAFIYLAYSMMALLYETVPAFEDTWIECLGDLARYRMAIEDDDIRDREIWTGVARHWYSKASDKAPTTGRLYHHLAILARPNAMEQLFHYSKSLCVAIPFVSARESIMTLFDPLLTANHDRVMPIDASFMRIQAMLFSRKANVCGWPEEFSRDLDARIERTGRRWLQSGYFIGISLSCSLLEFGRASLQMIPDRQSDAEGSAPPLLFSSHGLDHVLCRFFGAWDKSPNQTNKYVWARVGDPNVIPYSHVTHVFYYIGTMAYDYQTRGARIPLSRGPHHHRLQHQNEPECPKERTADYPTFDDEDTNFPVLALTSPRPLPEDYAMRGLQYFESYLPLEYFSQNIDEDEKYFELDSIAEDSVTRTGWFERWHGILSPAAQALPGYHDMQSWWKWLGNPCRDERLLKNLRPPPHADWPPRTERGSNLDMMENATHPEDRGTTIPRCLEKSDEIGHFLLAGLTSLYVDILSAVVVCERRYPRRQTIIEALTGLPA